MHDDSQGYYGLRVIADTAPFSVPLPYQGELVLGSDADCDVPLHGAGAAGKHACIVCDGARLSIVNLDSSLGTFVNGERVRKHGLALGDRIHLGSNTLELVAFNALGEAPSVPRPALARVRRQSMSPEQLEHLTMSGNIADVAFADLLQLFGRTRKSGVLNVDSELHAAVWLRDGRIIAATLRRQSGEPAQSNHAPADVAARRVSLGSGR